VARHNYGDEEALGKAYDARLMRRLLRYMWPYRWSVAGALVLMLVNSTLQVIGPLLTKFAVDRYLAPVESARAGVLAPYFSADPWTGMTQVSLLFLFTLVVGLAAEFSQAYLMQWTGQRAMFDLRRQVMGHLQKLDIAFYDRNPVGRLVTRVTTDADALNELFSAGLVSILGDIVLLSILVATMLKLSPEMTGLLLAAAPLGLAATLLFRKQAIDSYRRIRVAVAKINAYLQERLTGIAVVQLFNREARSREEFDEINREHRDAYRKAIIAYGWFYPVIEFIGMLALAGLIVWGGFQIRDGALTLGVLVAFFQYGLRFFRPIQDLSEKYNILQSAMAASERVFKLLDTPAAILAPASPRELGRDRAAIAFDGVWFAYQEPEWVLEDVSFRVESGETIALVGHTGAGKTTITSLMLRFYDAQRGAISIGGRDIRELDPRALRRRFGVVLQDPHLFTGTLEENIRLGTDGIPRERVLEAVDRVNLGDFVNSLPDGLAYAVRERGAGLSTGQKQLISFARALAHDPRFLILDEATSSVDTETEMKIRDALNRLLEGRTSIVIAHRLSTIQRADRILVMHRGQLRESGTHQQLLAARGLYYKLYQLQFKDQELPVAR
jgi:ATP-binding cassette subfamily B multidrug efflux pump